jgi:hypothetical protein
MCLRFAPDFLMVYLRFALELLVDSCVALGADGPLQRVLE